MNDVLAILQGIDQLLNIEDQWHKREMARVKAGWFCNPLAVDAYSFCLVGATHRSILNHFGYEPMYSPSPGASVFTILTSKQRRTLSRVFDILRDKSDMICPIEFNDSTETTFEDVKTVIAQSIEIAEMED